MLQLLLLLGSLSWAGSAKDIDLANVVFEGTEAQHALYESLGPDDKRVYLQLQALGAFEEKDGAKGATASRHVNLYKSEGRFFLEAYVKVPTGMDRTSDVLSGFGRYGTWALKDINKRRGGKKGSFFFDIRALGFSPSRNVFSMDIGLNVLWKGVYRMFFALRDELGARPVPKFALEYLGRSRLVSSMGGTFKLLPSPKSGETLLYFFGRAKVHWFFYYVIPLRVIDRQLKERVTTIFDNFQREVLRTSAAG